MNRSDPARTGLDQRRHSSDDDARLILVVAGTPSLDGLVSSDRGGASLVRLELELSSA